MINRGVKDLEFDKFIQTEADEIAVRTINCSGLIKDSFDYLAITYVTAGNGVGEIETVTYKDGGSSGTVVGTLTLAYDSNNRVVSVTKS